MGDYLKDDILRIGGSFEMSLGGGACKEGHLGGKLSMAWTRVNIWTSGQFLTTTDAPNSFAYRSL